MDPADMFVNLYDLLSRVHADTLSDWSMLPDVERTAMQVCADVRRTGDLPQKWQPQGSTEQHILFGILLGLDRALLDVGRDTKGDQGALAYLSDRMQLNGRLNDQTSGLLLPRRASALRPGRDQDSIDSFLSQLRVPPHISTNLQVHPVSSLYDFAKKSLGDVTMASATPPPLTIAQLPLLAEPADIRWTTDQPESGFYNIVPETARIENRLTSALSALDRSGAALAVLPEGCLDDHLLDKWRKLLATTPKPESSNLTWLLLGTGPVVTEGPRPTSRRPPNRAVLVHRNGSLVLATQDKRWGFCFTTEKQDEYKVDLGNVTRDEYIAHDPSIILVESLRGRFAVQICEDFGRLERQLHLIKAGVTHVLVPVLAAPMWDQGWQADAGQTLALEVGAKAVVSNGLAILRFFKEQAEAGGDPATASPDDGEPATTLLTIAGPTEPPEQYLSRVEIVHTYANPDAKTMTPEEDALAPRKAEW
jgi:hypothetical protein